MGHTMPRAKRTDVTRYRAGPYCWGVDRYDWGWGWWAEHVPTGRGTRSGGRSRADALRQARDCVRRLGANVDNAEQEAA